MQSWSLEFSHASFHQLQDGGKGCTACDTLRSERLLPTFDKEWQAISKRQKLGIEVKIVEQSQGVKRISFCLDHIVLAERILPDAVRVGGSTKTRFVA